MRDRLHSVFTASIVAALASAACEKNSTIPPEPAPTDSSTPAEPPAEPAEPPAPAQPSGPAVAEFAGDTCDPAALVARFGEAKLAKSYDYVELRVSQLQPDKGEQWKVLNSQVVASFGASCKDPKTAKACTKALAKATSPNSLFPPGAGRMPTSTYLVAQSGADVTTITTRAELVALFGTVDAPVEAMFLTTLDGYAPLCDASKVREVEGGYELLAKKNFNECLNQFHGHLVTVKGDAVTSQAEVDLTKPDDGCAVAGRRPEGFRPAPRTPDSALVAYLDEMHHLEAASVPAFERLACELAHHGAPAALIERAEAAARDEVRHAAGFAGLRERLAATDCGSPAIEVPTEVRSLEALALENAVEGCVRETFGALVARYQASVAADEPLRRLFAAIAEDELDHAALAWDVATWLYGQLDEAARERVRAAEAAELARMTVALATTEPDAEVSRLCGVPGPAIATAMFERCKASLWAA
ncbi:ferritin-like domain-containing protein [Nannocystis bainbridge]|uniref:Ferritin-like domain-containing protein n=1 Tax=Nannocystis bainbridge TaxID=2995303 RepID=A0ABT5DTD2_9BACT|nr:ferritin-like domain-containing protein [Nannocystis bainbridge]MDC0715983.1 ferritin-like domain-containing protein [Nannocystis bainbridge]